MIRLIILGLLVYFGYRFLKAKGFTLLKTTAESDPHPASQKETELIRDPQCGTYFLRGRGTKARIEGRTLYFCSEACRDAYLKSNQPH